MNCRIKTRVYQAMDDELSFIVVGESGKMAFVKFENEKDAEEWIEEIKRDYEQQKMSA